MFKTNRQLGFFDTHDELWWNVTGNGWMFPIDRVTSTITLPFEVEAGQLGLALYVGAFGSTETRPLHSNSQERSAPHLIEDRMNSPGHICFSASYCARKG